MSERIDDIKFLVAISLVTLFGTCLTGLIG